MRKILQKDNLGNETTSAKSWVMLMRNFPDSLFFIAIAGVMRLCKIYYIKKELFNWRKNRKREI